MYCWAAIIMFFSIFLTTTQVCVFSNFSSISSLEPIRTFAPLFAASSKKVCPSSCAPESAIKASPGTTSLLSDKILLGIEASHPSTTPPARVAKSDTFQCVIIEPLPPFFATTKSAHRDRYMEFYDFHILFLALGPFRKSQLYRHFSRHSKRHKPHPYDQE